MMITTKQLAAAGSIVLCLAAATLGPLCAPALASHQQVAMFEDPGLISNPAPTLSKLRALGADHVRLFLMWDSVAPSARLPPAAPPVPRR